MRRIVLLLLCLTLPLAADSWEDSKYRWKARLQGTPLAGAVPQSMGMFETLGQRAAEAPLRKLMKTLEETRGLKFKKFVPWHVKDRQELGVFFARQMELYYPDHQSQLDQGMLLHLGLVKPGFSIRGFMQELFTEQIAGAYDPDTKEFFAVDVRQDLFTKMLVGEEAHLVLLFHELDHALGDQYYDLKKLQMEAVKAHNTDMAMARAAVFEGDATLVMFDFQMRGTGMNADDSATNMGDMVDWLVKFPIPLPGMGGYQKAPLYFKKSLIFPYYNGMDFVRELRRFGGWKTVNQAYSQLPNSTEQILHPEKYLLTFAADPPVPVHLKKLPREVNGWKASQHDDTGVSFWSEFSWNNMRFQRWSAGPPAGVGTATDSTKRGKRAF